MLLALSPKPLADPSVNKCFATKINQEHSARLEPAWHRRARRSRSLARPFLKQQKAVLLLDSHHGSQAPSIFTMNMYDNYGYVHGYEHQPWYNVGKGRGNKRYTMEGKGKGKNIGKGGMTTHNVHVPSQQQQQLPPQHAQLQPSSRN